MCVCVCFSDAAARSAGAELHLSRTLSIKQKSERCLSAFALVQLWGAEAKRSEFYKPTSVLGSYSDRQCAELWRGNTVRCSLRRDAGGGRIQQRRTRNLLILRDAAPDSALRFPKHRYYRSWNGSSCESGPKYAHHLLFRSPPPSPPQPPLIVGAKTELKRCQNGALEDAASLLSDKMRQRSFQTKMTKTLSFIYELIEDMPGRAYY